MRLGEPGRLPGRLPARLPPGLAARLPPVMPPQPETGEPGRLRSQSGRPGSSCSPGGRSDVAQCTVDARRWFSGLVLRVPAGDCGCTVPLACAAQPGVEKGPGLGRAVPADAGRSGLKLGSTAVAKDASGLSAGSPADSAATECGGGCGTARLRPGVCSLLGERGGAAAGEGAACGTGMYGSAAAALAACDADAAPAPAAVCCLCSRPSCSQ